MFQRCFESQHSVCLASCQIAEKNKIAQIDIELTKRFHGVSSNISCSTEQPLKCQQERLISILMKIHLI